MKKLLLTYGAILATVIFPGCNKNDNPNSGYVPAANITAAFQTKFPGASNVKWIKSGIYERATFVDVEKSQAEAWFLQDARCLLTGKNLTYEQLPSKVKEGFQMTGNTAWTINHVDWVDKTNFEPAYIIEVKEPQVNSQRIESFRYTENGLLLEKESGSLSEIENARFTPVNIPSQAITHLGTKYPNAIRIDGIRNDEERFEITIRDGNINKLVFYNEDGDWKGTEWPIETQEIPAGAKDRIIEEGHEISQISEAKEIDSPMYSEHYYAISVINSAGIWYQYYLLADGSSVLP